MKNLTLENLTRSAAVFISDRLTSWSRRFPLLQQTAGKQKPEPYLFPS